MKYPYELVDDAKTLASFKGWSEEVYGDFLRVQRGTMSETQFNKKYHRQCAILSMDMTGFTTSAIKRGQLQSLLRIVDVQKVCIPVFQEFGASLIRCFADDIVALFETPQLALDAAFEVHRRIEIFNQSSLASGHPARCCAGIGFGTVFAIGPNLAQGDEMNQASKLGEDIARAGETLITQSAYAAMADRQDVLFEAQTEDDQLFPYFRALPHS